MTALSAGAAWLPSGAALAEHGWRLGYLGGLGVLAAMFLWNAGIRRIGALNAMLVLSLMPVITFAVRGRTMYPPEVSLHAEDSILAAWETQAAEMLAALRTDGIVDEDVTLQVVSGNGWDQALDDAEWEDGEILALGTSPRGDIARVFLGTRGTKILRVSPVPVLVLPG